MESKSLKDKILYWGGMTLISTVIIGGSYYIYQSLFGSEEKEKEENEDNENNSLNNSIQLNDSIQNIQKNNNNEINTSNNINNNINSKLIKDDDILNEENEEKIPNNINIFNNNIIFLKSFGINIDESKILKNSNNKLTDEGIIRLIIYFNFLADKFYLLDNPSLDEKRRALLHKKNNSNDLIIEQEYLTLCNETLICKQNAYQIATQKILDSLKIKVNMDEFDEFLKNIESKKLEELSIKVMTELNPQLHKYDLNIMDINKTKEVYIYYLKIFIDNAKKILEQKENNIINENNNNIINENNNIINNNESNNMFIFQFMTLKMQMDDQLYEKYKIVDEHLKLLVNKYNLFSDNEVNQLQNEFDDINSKFGNMKL